MPATNHFTSAHKQQILHDPYSYIIRGEPGGLRYFGELDKHCFWGNEVKLYKQHVDKLFAMFLSSKPRIMYYVCTMNKTFATQRMYFQVHYTNQNLRDYIQEAGDNLPLKLASSSVTYNSRFMLGVDKRATITTNWSSFLDHASIQQGDICAFQFKHKATHRLSLTVHRL